VVDYLQEDFTRNGRSYDAIIDAVGKYSFVRGRRALKRGGVYVATDLGPFVLETIAMLVATRWVGSKRVKMQLARRTTEDVLFLKERIEAGEFRAVIDRRYPMDQVIEAHRYVETLRKTGNVVLTVAEG
jgi:NADPH:quinone reductase-like Zn-dependent oxidoreductase